MSEFFYDVQYGYYKIKSRVYKVVDRKNNFLWYSWEESQEMKIGDEVVEQTTFCMTDFCNGSWLGLTEDDKARALTRKYKG